MEELTSKNLDLSNYIPDCYKVLPRLRAYSYPWQLITDLEHFVDSQFQRLSKDEFLINNRIAIHKSAVVESGVTIKPQTIIGKDCIVKSGTYLRNGVYLLQDVAIGTNCEVKQSIIFPKSRIAHLNYVGNSIIGSDVNMEAGSVLANHFNERVDKTIFVKTANGIINTECVKFGSIIGDRCRIGANAVLNPGCILEKNTVVGRLEYVDQLK